MSVLRILLFPVRLTSAPARRPTQYVLNDSIARMIVSCGKALIAGRTAATAHLQNRKRGTHKSLSDSGKAEIPGAGGDIMRDISSDCSLLQFGYRSAWGALCSEESC